MATQTAEPGYSGTSGERTVGVRAAARWAGSAAIAAALLMIVGAALWIVSGADLDAALEDGSIVAYLSDAAANENVLVVNLSVWIVGVTMLAIAGTGLAALGDRSHPATSAARVVYTAGAPLAAVAFITWLALIRLAATAVDPAAVATLADSLGWIASRADWVATIFLVAIGPGLLSLSGRDGWVPRWLGIWGAVALAAGLLAVIALFAGGLTTYGFLVVPIGLGWTIAAGITVLRSA